MKFRILVSGGPGMVRSFDNVAEMKEFVERYVPMKRGWRGEWETTSRQLTFAYKRFNSNGNRVRGDGVLVRRLAGCDDTCTVDCGSCKGRGNRVP